MTFCLQTWIFFIHRPYSIFIIISKSYQAGIIVATSSTITALKYLLSERVKHTYDCLQFQRLVTKNVRLVGIYLYLLLDQLMIYEVLLSDGND